MKKEIKEGQIIFGNLLTNEKAFITTSFGVYTGEGIYPICPVKPSRVGHLLRNKIMTLRGLGKYFTYDGKILLGYTSSTKHILTAFSILKAFPIIPEDKCGFLLRELRHTPESVIKITARGRADLFEILSI